MAAESGKKCVKTSKDLLTNKTVATPSSLELRVVTSLARLWQSQDQRQAAYDLLAPV